MLEVIEKYNICNKSNLNSRKILLVNNILNFKENIGSFCQE